MSLPSRIVVNQAAHAVPTHAPVLKHGSLANPTHIPTPGHEGAGVALVGSEVVAVAVVARDFDRDALRSNFDLDGAFPPCEFPPGSLGCLVAAVVNPIFEPHAAAFLSAFARLKGRRALVYAAPAPEAPPPCLAACVAQVAPRRAGLWQACVYGFTKSLCRKPCVHSRVSAGGIISWLSVVGGPFLVLLRTTAGKIEEMHLDRLL